MLNLLADAIDIATIMTASYLLVRLGTTICIELSQRVRRLRRRTP
jgi:hypothetical protein